MGFLTWLWNGLRQLAGLVLPFFAKARDFRSYGPGVRWTLRILLLIAIGVFFYFVERWTGLKEGLLNRGPQELKPFWLPLIVLALILFFWIGWWVWKLWHPEEMESAYPDIDEAWDEAMHALDQAGISIADAPLFFVLGRPAAGEMGLFNAAGMQWKVHYVPDRRDAPLHVFANRDAVFVTSAGASLMGRLAALFASAPEASAERPAVADSQDRRISQDVSASVGPQGMAEFIKSMVSDMKRDGRQPTEQEQQLLKFLNIAAESEPEPETRKPVQSFVRNNADIEHTTSRLQHLCRKIARERRPYCPINGMFLLIPFAGTDDKNANDTALLCQKDVLAARQIFQLHFPTLAMVCDLERTEGYKEFVERFPKSLRDHRLGQGFPWVPDVEAAALPDMIGSGTGWVCQSLLPFWVYKLFRLETGRDNAEDVTRSNAQLYRLMAQISARHTGLARILMQGLSVEKQEVPLFGGCYFAGTGLTPEQQAFIPGVFDKVVNGNTQNLVYWTEEALSEDDRFRRGALFGYIGTAAAIAVLIALLVWFHPWQS